ncbi:MAG: hypothetical protein LBL01_04045 [Bifidobacteriaceae bacterium]|jgi:hypothetical protein|nr:hypothetical protein [Bifidobacteriaceae bacterium]
MRKAALLLSICLAAGLGACTPAETPAAPEPTEEATRDAGDPTAPAEPSETPSEAAPASGEEIAVDEVLTDDVLGSNYKVISYIPSLPIPADFDVNEWAAYDGATVLAMQVEMSVDADTKYSVIAMPADLNLYGSGGNDIAAQGAEILMKEAYADQYPALEQAGVGETKTGWVGFILKDATGAAPFTVKVERQAAGVMGSDQTIPAAEFSFELPAA